MSWGEYRQRQRKTDSMSSLNAFGGNNNTDETDVSTLGFSLGSIQSAPAQIAQRETLSQNSAGGGSGCGGHNRGQNSRAGTAGIGSGSRGHSFTAFDNIDPLDGGVRVARATSSPPRNMQSARFGKGYRAPGPLSPLSMSVGDDGAGAGGGGAAGPEWIGDDDDSRDPHLQLLQVTSSKQCREDLWHWRCWCTRETIFTVWWSRRNCIWLPTGDKYLHAAPVLLC